MCKTMPVNVFKVYKNPEFSLSIIMGCRLFYNPILHFVIPDNLQSAQEPWYCKTLQSTSHTQQNYF